MIKISVLAHHHPYRGAVGDFYPLRKWDNQLKKEGLKFKWYRTHRDKKLLENDVVIIDHRYYRNLIIEKNEYYNKDFIIELALKLKNIGVKVILFDNADGSGSREWDMIEHVDLLVKKQILKNRKEYLLNQGVYSYMPFTKEYKLSKDRHLSNLDYEDKHTPCPPGQLHKIRLGWNIGMIDYRYFPFQKYYPFSTDRFLNSVYKYPLFYSGKNHKNLDSSFRGTINKKNENYAYQRNVVIELFKQDKYPGYITGPLLSKKKYLREMRNSKTCVSPFGYGEICYRDFEAIICGALLIKPDMTHIETYPNIFKKNRSYIPLKWDMTDLEETVVDAVENFDNYQHYIENAQRIYKEAITNHQGFIERFKKIILS